MKERVMVIGYDRTLSQGMESRLRGDGLYPYFVENLREAIGELDSAVRYSLVMVLDGTDVLRVIREIRRMSNVPILVVRRRYDGAEKIAALEMGADEYIQYPGRQEEGAASALALVRRYTEWNPNHGYVGCMPSEKGLCIIPEQRRVYINSREVSFARKEFDLLYTLASSPERVFTYEQLFSRVWGEDDDLAESCLHSCVNRIRRKLESVSEFTAKIENLPGIGYRYHEKTKM